MLITTTHKIRAVLAVAAVRVGTRHAHAVSRQGSGEVVTAG